MICMVAHKSPINSYCHLRRPLKAGPGVAVEFWRGHLPWILRTKSVGYLAESTEHDGSQDGSQVQG